MPIVTCSILDCTAPHYAKTLCRAHYEKTLRSKRSKTRPSVEERFWGKVEKSATCWNWTGSVRGGHGTIFVDGSSVYVHRLSWVWANGPIPKGMVIDHMCHNRGCVNPAHLRVVTTKQNLENYSVPPNSISGVRGVYWQKREKRYRVGVKHHSKMHWGGHFVRLEDAAAAVLVLRNSLHTHNDLDRRS